MARKHPMQKLYRDQTGVIRFRENAIVRYLLDTHGLANMNTLALIPFTKADREQFAQLIGYSVSGFGDLSYVRDETYNRAAEIAAALEQGAKP